MEPLDRTPVAKLTDPRACPAVAVKAFHWLSCDPVEVMVVKPIVPNPEPPMFENAIVPPLFVAIISAQADIGSANASNARTTTTRLMLILPNFPIVIPRNPP